MQVSSALLSLRQRNTYPGNTLPPSMKHPTNSTVYGGLPSSFDISISQESGSSVADIVEVSRLKAHTLVNAAVQVWGSLSMKLDVKIFGLCIHFCGPYSFFSWSSTILCINGCN